MVLSDIKNTIIHGNCMDIMQSIESDSIDCTISSPPYDNLRNYNNYEGSNDFDIKTIAKQLFRITKPGGIVIWVIGDAVVDGFETGTSFEHALTFRDVGLKIFDTMIYEKNTSSFPARKNGSRYTSIFEYMFVLSKNTKPKTHHLICDKPNKWAGWINWGKKTFRGKDGVLKEQRDIKPVDAFSPRNNIWRYAPIEYRGPQEDISEFYRYIPVFTRDEEADDVLPSPIKRYVVGGKYGQIDKEAYQHPATFPLQLAADHIQTWTNPGDIVFDPMVGSGTTVLAAKIMQRNYLGIDISKEYCELAEKRLANSDELSKKFTEMFKEE